MKYLPDTNIISAIIEDNEVVVKTLESLHDDGHVFIISAINYYEITRGLTLPKYQKKLGRFKAFLSKTEIIMLNMEILDTASEIYQQLKPQGKLIEDADTLIAATALYEQAVLVTDNTKHFARVLNLNLENWIERT
jgi:tRNA(fMet)-specific endonuclease VapC